jgi:GNAT superfamily N-acetyltransferase
MDSRLRRPAVAAPHIELVSVASARDVAQASLVLGEQRAWIERVTGLDLADVQPDEYGNLLDWYRPPAGRLLLARLDGEPVGVIGLRRQQDGVAQLRRLYVRPGARGRGVARRLVNEALRAAGLMGAALVYVETAPWSMPTAVRLLRRLGFTEGARRYMATIDGVVAMQRLVGSAAV